jgi:hypothetical protein
VSRQLRSASLRLGLIATAATFGAAQEIVIVDNDAAAPGYTETGAWTTSGSTGYEGGTYRFANVGGASTATWTATLSNADLYDVAVWYREGSNRATATRFEIQAAGPQVATVDQTGNGLEWVSLGTFDFQPGSATVTLDAAGSSGGNVVIADAVRFSQGGPPPPPPPEVLLTETIRPGVIHTEHLLPDPVHVHVVEFDLADPGLTIEMGFAQGRRNYGTAREPVSQIAARHDSEGHAVLAAVNCAFFSFDNIDVQGPLGSGGSLIGLPNNSWETYMLQDSAQGWISRGLPGALCSVRFVDDATMGINHLNLVRTSNTLALYTPVWGSTTATTDEGVEVIVENVSSPLRPDRRVAGTVTDIRTGPASVNNPIPAGGLVLSAHGAAASALLSGVSISDQISVRCDLSPPILNNAALLTGGAGWLVENGAPNTAVWSNFGFWNQRHPRTVLAWSGTRHWLVTFDGRQTGHSIGADFDTMADFLIGTLGVEQAINLDGGGSTTMVISGEVANCPSDGADPPCTGSERNVANALLLVERDPTSDLPIQDDFPASGRLAAWEDKFTFNPVVPFAPTAPGGDGNVLEVIDPTGGYDTVSIGAPGDADYAVEAWVLCDHRPEVNFESDERGGGNCYALTFDTDTGRIQAAVVVDGVLTDLRASDPLLLPSDAWRLFRIECLADRICFLVDGEVIADVPDSTHPDGRGGGGHHEYFSTNANAQGTRLESFLFEELTVPPGNAPSGLDLH